MGKRKRSSRLSTASLDADNYIIAVFAVHIHPRQKNWRPANVGRGRFPAGSAFYTCIYVVL